jgi:hypothetical protein
MLGREALFLDESVGVHFGGCYMAIASSALGGSLQAIHLLVYILLVYIKER